MKRLPFPVISILLVLLLSSCSPPGESSVPEQEKSVPVRLLEIRTRDLPLLVESVGRLIPDREVTISAELGGVIDSFHADIGDSVKNGQTLVKIDPTDYRLALMEAEANLLVARTQLDATEKSYNRICGLLPKNAVSTEEFDKCEAAFKTAQASVSRVKVLVDIARERLNKTTIEAPFTGLIAARMVEKGQTVAPGQPLMTLVNLNPMRVKVYLTEMDYLDLDMEDPVSVIMEASPNSQYRGRIDRIGIKADARTNSFDLEILVENPDLSMKAGMTARVRITTSVIPDTIMIPQSAVLYRKDRREVFVAGPDQRAEVRQVELGRTEGGLVQILTGLWPGDRLITTGGQYLKAGDILIISPPGRA